MLQRLLSLVRYNRDWPKYLFHRYTSLDGNHPSITFHLRNHQSITVNRDGRFTLNEIYLDRVYDIPGLNLSDCRSILDIGANVGIFALYATSVSPQARVYCVEPVATNFAMLSRNLAANRVTRVQSYQLAVAAKCGTGHMQTSGTSVTHELSTAGTGSELVEIIDLRRLFELTGVDTFDFVKMDVEGAELDILCGCADEELRRMRAISLEWHYSTQELGPVLERLRRLGFQATPEFSGRRPKYLKARLHANA